jgi:hypothetical protein
MHVMEAACWNLLQIDFLSPHSLPSLYTKTMLSLCAMASFAESGDQHMPRTTYVFDPFGSAGLVENLSRRSPFSSHKCTTRSVVTMASRRLLADQQMPVTLAMLSCGAWIVFKWRSCMATAAPSEDRHGRCDGGVLWGSHVRWAHGPCERTEHTAFARLPRRAPWPRNADAPIHRYGEGVR